MKEGFEGSPPHSSPKMNRKKKHESRKGRNRGKSSATSASSLSSTKSTTDDAEAPTSSAPEDETGIEGSTTHTEDADEASTHEQTEESTNGSGAGAESSAKSATTDEDSGWTISKDNIIKGMKEDNPSMPWAEIGAALGRSKTEVKDRWRIIKDRPSESTGNEAEIGAPAEPEEEKVTSPESKTQRRQKKTRKSGKCEKEQVNSEVAESPESNPEGNGVSKSKGKQKRVEDSDNGTSQDDTSILASPKKQSKKARAQQKHSHEKNSNIHRKKKQSKKETKSAASQFRHIKATNFSDEEPSIRPSSSTSSSPNRNTYFWGDSEKNRQKRYMVKHVWSELYPPKIRLRPDHVFNQEDCDILATVDSKYKRSQWLEMQAGFFNVTGRMVPVDVIRSRFEAAEAVEDGDVAHIKGQRRGGDRGLDNRLRKVEKWMSKMARQQEIRDPNI